MLGTDETEALVGIDDAPPMVGGLVPGDMTGGIVPMSPSGKMKTSSMNTALIWPGVSGGNWSSWKGLYRYAKSTLCSPGKRGMSIITQSLLGGIGPMKTPSTM